MPERNQVKSPPRKILLATDLSSRGDRALDRAAQLARQWEAQLHIVHVIDRRSASLSQAADFLSSWRRSPDTSLAIQSRIRRDLREEVDQLKIHVEEGETAEVILDLVAREGCDLIVLGVGSDSFSARRVLGSNVERLVRRSPVSVLVVKSRPSGTYRHILIGTDFTEESRYGLEMAARSFPNSRFTVMHAFEMPYGGILSDAALSRDFAAMEQKAIVEFVRDAALGDQVRSQIRTIIEHGSPDLMLCRYVEEEQADLTVIGAYGRGLLFHLLIGGNAPRIVDWVPSDILLVRAHREGLSSEGNIMSE